MRVRTMVVLFTLGCGGGADEPGGDNTDTGASDTGVDTGTTTDAPAMKRPIAQVVSDYIVAWQEADATKRMARLDASVTKNFVFVDGTLSTKTSAELSAEIGKIITKYRGVKMTLTSGVELQHERVRFLWKYTDKTDAPIGDGLDLAFVGADGRLTKVVSFIDPVGPEPPTFDPVLTSFRDAFGTADPTKRLELLKKSLAGIYFDKTDGALDATALSAKIGTTPLKYNGFQEHNGGFRIPFTLGAKTGVFLGVRDTGGLMAEVSAFEGDPPKP